MHDHQTMIQMLDDWFCKCKVTTSNPDNPAFGRLDAIRQIPLFTTDTKTAVENCKEKVKYLADPFPIERMYQEMLPSPNATHDLSEHLSNRGESKLEAFHDRFSHFANCGMRQSLADNLNLAGTARYNLSIRHARALTSQYENPLTKEARKKISTAWEKVVPFFNHSELLYVNGLAKSVGCNYPFPAAEMLPPENGERFFSQYVTETLPSLKSIKHGPLGECMCTTCAATTTATATQQEMELNNEANHEVNNSNTQSVTAPATTATPTTKKTRKKQNNKQARQAAQCAVANSVNCIVPAPAYHPPVYYLP